MTVLEQRVREMIPEFGDNGMLMEHLERKGCRFMCEPGSELNDVDLVEYVLRLNTKIQENLITFIIRNG